jgi:PST family polysaccharide transporter
MDQPLLTGGPPGGSLRGRALTGLRWTMLNTLGERALSFGTTVVLARLLDPEHFGLYALAFVAIDALGIFKNLGLDAAIIQRQDRTEEAADTALWVLPVIGLTLSGVLALAAPLAAGWLGNPGLARPIQWLSASLILLSLGNVPAALLQKRLQFRERTVANLAGMLVYAGLAIALARSGWGIWSLVSAYLVRVAITAAGHWWLAGWRPGWRFDVALLRSMMRYSKYVVGANLLGLVVASMDKVVIGRMLGATQVGFYTLAAGLAYLASHQLSSRIYQVAFPAFAEAQHDLALLRRGFLKLLTFLCAGALPLSVLLGLFARPLIVTVYGPKWALSAPVLAVLALAGALQVFRLGIHPLLLACGRSRTEFLMHVCHFVVFLGVAPAAAARWGLVGVAWATTVSLGASAVIGGWAVIRHLRAPWAHVGAKLYPVGAALAVMGLVAWAMKALSGLTPLAVRASLGVACAAALVALAAYGLVLFRADRALFSELGRLMVPWTWK